MAMTRTAKEIIRNAKWFGNLRNSNTSDFETCNSVLNNEFYRLYNDIVRETDEFTQSFDFDGNEIPLPDDCMYVVGVYIKGWNNDCLSPVSPSPKGQYVPAEYKIENNTIRIIGSKSISGSYTVKYVTMPPTITAPDENEKLDIEADMILSRDDTTFYYRNNDVWYVYDTETKSSIETDEDPGLQRTYTYGDYTITCDYENSVFDVPDELQREELDIIWADFDWPYAVITYSDNSVWIYTGFDGTEWNVFNTSGHATRGRAWSLKTNDTTGKGIVFTNNRDGKIYWCSFVPDTVLSYPHQVFFQLLEYRIASTLAAIIGLNATYVNEVLIPQAETLFYDTIKKDHFLPTRIINANRRKRIW